MSHAFAPVVAELKRLKNKLNSDTFAAVFAESPLSRQQAQKNACVVKKEMEEILGSAYNDAAQICDLLRMPGRDGLDTVEAMINLVEMSSSKMGAGSQQSAR